MTQGVLHTSPFRHSFNSNFGCYAEGVKGFGNYSNSNSLNGLKGDFWPLLFISCLTKVFEDWLGQCFVGLLFRLVTSLILSSWSVWKRSWPLFVHLTWCTFTGSIMQNYTLSTCLASGKCLIITIIILSSRSLPRLVSKGFHSLDWSVVFWQKSHHVGRQISMSNLALLYSWHNAG